MRLFICLICVKQLFETSVTFFVELITTLSHLSQTFCDSFVCKVSHVGNCCIATPELFDQ